MSPAQYPYKKLKKLGDGTPEIRLIRLKPGRGSEEIECELFHTVLRGLREDAGYEKRRRAAIHVRNRQNCVHDWLTSPKFTRLSPEKQESSRKRGYEWIDKEARLARTTPILGSAGLRGAQSGFPATGDASNQFSNKGGNLNRAASINSGLNQPSAAQAASSSRHPPYGLVPYEALSYMWGDQQWTETILIDDHEIPIGENLFAALTALRYLDCFRVLWIDAICINQSDVLERNAQVQLMGKIYSSAARVVSFVGDGISNVATGLAFAEMCNKGSSNGQLMDYVRHWKYEQHWKAIKDLLTHDYWKRIWIIQEIAVAQKVTVYFGEQTTEWEVIATFFKRLNSLSDGLNKQIYLPKHVSELLTTVPATLCSLRESLSDNERWTLKTLLETFRHSLSTDPRDKIYGLLGLDNMLPAKRPQQSMTGLIAQSSASYPVSPAPRKAIIEPDYGKSVFEIWEELSRSERLRDPFHVIAFSQFAQKLFGGGDLRIHKGIVNMNTGKTKEINKRKKKRYKRRYTRKKGRLAAGAEGAAQYALLHQHRYPKAHSLYKRLMKGASAAAPGDADEFAHRSALDIVYSYFPQARPWSLSPSEAPLRPKGLIYVPGTCQSSIGYLGPPYRSPPSSVRLITKWLALFFHQVNSLDSERKLPSILLDSIVQAQHDLPIVQGIDSSQSYGELGKYSYVTYRERELGGYSEKELGLESAAFDSSIFRSHHVCQASNSHSKDRPRWFISDRGHIGLAPSNAQEGDRLCQFRDSDVVALIRKSGEDNRCELIGRGHIMPKGDEDVISSSRTEKDRFRYSIPHENLFRDEFRKDVIGAIEQYRVSLYLEIEALYALTRVSG